MSKAAKLLITGGLLVTLGGREPAAEARPAEDDLAVVRRAVARNEPAPVKSPATDKAPLVEEKDKARKGAPQWLRVRITERGGKKVSVNLPLALARAVGDDLPLDWGCHRRCDGERASVRLGDVLKSLDSGQDIVQIDSDDSTVRVWVE